MNDNSPVHLGDHALIAATQASRALAELLRFLRDGEAHPGSPFDEVDCVFQLAEAAMLAAEMTIDAQHVDADEREMLGQFIGACRRFIEGWA